MAYPITGVTWFKVRIIARDEGKQTFSWISVYSKLSAECRVMLLFYH